MLNWLINWVILTFSITITAYFLPFITIAGDTTLDRAIVAFAAGLLLGLFNSLVRPLIKILSLPINILTLGLFNIIINAGILWIVDQIVEGLKIIGFSGYIWSTLLISFINMIISKIIFFRKRT